MQMQLDKQSAPNCPPPKNIWRGKALFLIFDNAHNSLLQRFLKCTKNAQNWPKIRKNSVFWALIASAPKAHQNCTKSALIWPKHACFQGKTVLSELQCSSLFLCEFFPNKVGKPHVSTPAKLSWFFGDVLGGGVHMISLGQQWRQALFSRTSSLDVYMALCAFTVTHMPEYIYMCYCIPLAV